MRTVKLKTIAVNVAFLLCWLTFVIPLQGRVLQPARPEVVGVSAERLKALTEVIETAVFEDEIPGAVALVARKGRVVYRRAFGFRAEEPELEPMTVDSIFDVASLTKVLVTAPAIMMLVEDGKLSLLDEVGLHIPEFARRGKSKITILQLLTHYSGLRPDLDLAPKWKGYGKAIELACREKPVEVPGKRFIYSDINYFMLGEIVRRVSGSTLDEFVAKRMFEPLLMQDTGFRPGQEKLKRIAPTNERDGELLRGVVHDPTCFRMGGVAGHAGLFSTVDDIAIWAQMILNGGFYNGARILSPLGVRRMTIPQSPKEAEDWRGLGFDIQTRFSTARGDLFPLGSFGHTGFTGTSLWIDPYSKTFVILFTSRLHPDRNGNTVTLRQRVASIVAASLVDFPPEREGYSIYY